MAETWCGAQMPQAKVETWGKVRQLLYLTPNIHRDQYNTHLNTRVKHPWPMFISRALKTASTATTTTSRAMSSVNIHTLQRMTAKTLSEKLLQEREAANPTFAVIDVRDDGTFFSPPRPPPSFTS